MKKSEILAFAASMMIGCATSMKLPSVTLGGAANKDAVVSAKCDKQGLGVTLPLVNVDVPWPKASVNKEE